MASSTSNEIVKDFSPMLRVYKDGTVERLSGSPFVPPSPEDPATGVSSKDIKISSDVSARLYIPKNTEPLENLPILVYFHAGAFCVESAFSCLHQRYLNLLVSQAKVVAVSVEYRLAPEHPLPAVYEDCWTALQWVASHVVDNSNTDKDPWLLNHGNFNKLYIGGDSAGGNIVHNIAIKAGVESLHGDVKIIGGFLSHPYFWGSKTESSRGTNEQSLPYRLWLFIYPSAPGGIDNPMVNPLAEDAPSLSGIACSKLFVCVSEKDEFRDTTLLYVEALKKSDWKGELDLVDVEGEEHCFQLFNPDADKAKNLISRLASFIRD
nr:HID4 [Melodinus tenuicaudatus]